MKKSIIYKSILCIFAITLMLLHKNVYAEDFLQGDYVYYNPVSDSACSPAEYWTNYNQNTNCYRWVVLYKTGTELRLLLDHNYYNDVTYNEFATKINQLKTLWPNSNVSAIGSSAILTIMNFDIDKAIAEVKSNGTVGYGQSRFLSYLNSNYYYIDSNGTIKNSNGYWIYPTSSTYNPPSGKAYVYQGVSFRIIDQTEKRGIRPSIQIESSKVTSDINYRRNINDASTITLRLNGDTYNNNQFDTISTTHGMQGFNVHNGKYCMYLTNASSDNNAGYIFCNDTKTFTAKTYGHGNDISYNSNNNKYIMHVNRHSDDTSSTKTTFHEASSLTQMDTKLTGSNTMLTLPNPTRGSIAYDSEHDRYYAGNAYYMAAVKKGDTSISNRSIIDISTDYGYTPQGIEYHKGYLYDVYYVGGTTTNNVTKKAWEKDVCNSGLVRCDKYPKDQGLIYIYNAKLSKNGTPSKGYGKLITILNTNFLKNGSTNFPGVNYSSRTPIHNEIEGVSFNNDSADTMFIGTTTHYSSYGFYPKVYSIELDDMITGGTPRYMYSTTVKYTDTSTETQKYYWNDLIDTNYYDLGSKHLGWIYSRSDNGTTTINNTYKAKNSTIKTTLTTTKNGIVENLKTVKLESSKYSNITSTNTITVTDTNIQTFISQLTCTRCSAVVLENGTAKTSGNFIYNKEYKLNIKASDTNNTIILTKNLNVVFPTAISLNKSSLSMIEGNTYTLTATITPSNAIDKSVTWTSNNTSVATVDSTGKVTAISVGTATITAKTNNNKTATCTVTVSSTPIDDLPFLDVPKNSWYYNSVKEAYNRRIIAGYSTTKFGPNDKVTRGQLVTFLYRIEGEPSTILYDNPFSDVKTGEYYTDAVKWAAKKKIVNGYGNTGTFGPNNKIIRQDLAVILNNYSKYKGYSYTGTANLSSFADYNKVKGGYAEPALKWAVQYKIISGKTINNKKYIAPLDNASRAETAAMIVNFLDTFN